MQIPTDRGREPEEKPSVQLLTVTQTPDDSVTDLRRSDEEEEAVVRSEMPADCGLGGKGDASTSTAREGVQGLDDGEEEDAYSAGFYCNMHALIPGLQVLDHPH